MEQKYAGTVVSVLDGGRFCFIGAGSVTTENGALPDTPVSQDIYLHQDECATALKVGMEVTFFASEDLRRGEGCLRAFGAVEVLAGELVPAKSEVFPGFGITCVPQSQLAAIVPRSLYHVGAKQVPQETVDQVIKNQPMPGVPRSYTPGTEDDALRFLELLLRMFYPSLHHFDADFNLLEASTEDLDEAVKENEGHLAALGMRQEIDAIRREVKGFRSLKGTLKLMYEDGLIRPDTVVPIKNLPDLFMAVPVWYFWTPPEDALTVQAVWENRDPIPQEPIKYFCDLFPNANWGHTYQMFNRRMRSLAMYKGDTIPLFASRRLRKSVEAFDYIVIATPYHSEAGKDWNDIRWLQMIDPYILGFKKGVPYFFILARFSNDGVFPLYHEMLADTMEFLKHNKDGLRGFNRVSSPYWYQPHQPMHTSINVLGDVLINHTDKLINAFERGELFDWLRGETANAAVMKL